MIIAKTAKAYSEGKRYIVNEGGTRSGKTFGVLAVLITLAMRKPNILISVVSETFPHLRKGVIRDFETHFKNGLGDSWNKSESTYTFPNGSKIEFFSVDSPGKVHGPARDILFINEAQNVGFEIARHLFVRTTGTIFIDFNPTHEFWAHTEIKDDSETTWIHSTYNDNPFLTSAQIKEIERNKKNSSWWTVYGEGKIGSREGLVFPEIELVDEMPDGRSVYGLDFGYTNDPAAFIEVLRKDDDLYLKEHIYTTGLQNSDLFNMISNNVEHWSEVFADSAEPKSVDYLYSKGLNIKGSAKGKNSVLFGIDLMKQFNIKVTKDSTNLINELRNYTYMKDKNGKVINYPIDDFNHAIDAVRYAVMEKYKPLALDNTILQGHRNNKI